MRRALGEQGNKAAGVVLKARAEGFKTNQGVYVRDAPGQHPAGRYLLHRCRTPPGSAEYPMDRMDISPSTSIPSMESSH